MNPKDKINPLAEENFNLQGKLKFRQHTKVTGEATKTSFRRILERINI